MFDEQAIQEVYNYLPWWVGWGQFFVHIPVVFFFSLILTWLGTKYFLYRWQRDSLQHWSERVRWAFSARGVVGTSLLVMTIFSGAAVMLLPTGLSRLPESRQFLLGALAGFLGVSIVSSRVETILRGKRVTLRTHFWNMISYSMLFGWFPLLVLMIAGLILPWRFNTWAIGILSAMSAFLIYWLLGGGMRTMKLVGLLRPACKRVQAIVEQTAVKMGVQLDSIYEVRIHHANAFAFPTIKAIGFTSGIVEALDDDQLAAICRHELAHVDDTRYRTLSLISTIYLFCFLPLVAIKPLIGVFGFQIVLPILGAVGAATVLKSMINARIRRRGEEHADAEAAGEGFDEGEYAQALEDLYRFNRIPVTFKSMHGHPPLYDRMTAVGVNPDYPRPQPPSKFPTLLASAFQIIFFVGVCFGLIIAMAIGSVATSGNWQSHRMSIALLGGSQRSVADLARLRYEAGAYEEAFALYRFACVKDDRSPELPARLAIMLAARGRCAEAQKALDEAMGRQQRYRDNIDDRDNRAVKKAQRYLLKRCSEEP